MATKRKPVKKTEPYEPEPTELFLTIKAYCGLTKTGKHSNIKLEIDLSPPFEMLDTNLDNSGSVGFKKQKAPHPFDVVQLEKLFTYINKVLPLTILKIAEKDPTAKAIKGAKLKLRGTDPLKKLFALNGEEFTKAINGVPWNPGELPKAGKPGEYDGVPSAFTTNRTDINDALVSLNITRVFVDPSKKSVNTNRSGSGGDVPPPSYPPG